MTMDASYISIAAHALSELVLAMRMSAINAEQMRVAVAASKRGESAKKAARDFLKTTYYRSWSRAQLNNTEYAPMLALLIFAVKYRADKEQRDTTLQEKLAAVASVVFSYMFLYAAANQGSIDHKNMKPGSAGMSPLRPVGALGRYAAMGVLIYQLIRRRSV